MVIGKDRLWALALVVLALSFTVWPQNIPSGSGKLVNTDKDANLIPLTVVKALQEDSPLNISGIQVDSSAGKFHLIDYSLQNISQKNIKAYAITNDKGGTWTSFLGRFLVPGQLSLEQQREEDVNLHGGGTLAMSVDFVLFEDGSGWGKDTSGMSKNLLGYFEGLTAATVKASELLVVANENVLETALVTESGEKAPSKIPSKESDVWKQGYAQGYRVAFNRLKSAYESQGKEAVEKRLKELEKLAVKKP